MARGFNVVFMTMPEEGGPDTAIHSLTQQLPQTTDPFEQQASAGGGGMRVLFTECLLLEHMAL